LSASPARRSQRSPLRIEPIAAKRSNSEGKLRDSLWYLKRRASVENSRSE
jgi:hypothetical protein